MKDIIANCVQVDIGIVTVDGEGAKCLPRSRPANEGRGHEQHADARVRCDSPSWSWPSRSSVQSSGRGERVTLRCHSCSTRSQGDLRGRDACVLF